MIYSGFEVETELSEEELERHWQFIRQLIYVAERKLETLMLRTYRELGRGG